MKQFMIFVLFFSGVCLLTMATLVLAQDTPPLVSAYAGTNECRECHRQVARPFFNTPHARTFVAITDDMTPILGDFSTGEDLRHITLENETRPFLAEDIAYTLGSGRNIQAYVYEMEPGELYVLPAIWNVHEEAWEPYELAEEWPDETYVFGPNCAGCHTQKLDVTSYTWKENGVMCEACHGPGMMHVEVVDDAGGVIDEDERIAISESIGLMMDAEVCGRCHIRGLNTDGIHPYPTDYTSLVDNFEIAPPEDSTHFWSTGHAKLPNMQYNEWLSSGHPNALITARESEAFDTSCLSCHSTTQVFMSDDMHPAGITCAACHDPHPAEVTPNLLRDDGYALCVRCHQNDDTTEDMHHPVKQVYEGIALIEGVDVEASPHFMAEDGPTCTTCHMPAISTENGARSSHLFDIIAPGAAPEGLPDSCTGCHEQSQTALQQLIDDLQNDTQQRIHNVRAEVADDTSESVKVALDIVENEGSYGVHNYAYTSALLDHVEQALNLQSLGATEADVSAQMNAILPEVEPTDVLVESSPIAQTTGLAGAAIYILASAAFILIFSAFAFFRSNG